MSWEKRGDRRYYYNKRRVGDRVISEYVGAGEFAQVCAALDALKREMRHAQRERRRADRALDAQVDQVCDLIRALTGAALLVAGHHTHKGQWRKRRYV